jgi:hypothetical protein
MKEPIDSKLARLKAIGFTLAGRWSLMDGQLAFELDQLGSARNVLYAFVVDGQLMYVGKTTQTLHSRMGGYKSPAQS